MKSAPLADTTLALVAEPIEFTAPEETASEGFGIALEEATDDHEPVIDSPAAKTDTTNEEAIVISNVAYFCPPPQIDPVKLAAANFERSNSAAPIDASEAPESAT